MRLRRARDRKRVSHGGKTPVSLAAAAAAGAVRPEGPGGPTPDARLAPVQDDGASDHAGADGDSAPDAYDGVGPMLIREKTHRAEPMTLDQALYEMELVGHDFYLFVDATAGQPSVVYRRKGYSYGVLHLAV